MKILHYPARSFCTSDTNARILYGKRRVVCSALSTLPRSQILRLIAISLSFTHGRSAQALQLYLPPPPAPVPFPRKSLDQVFAVLLLRSGYEAVDQLNFIPMDEFQKLFWKLRQSYYEGYKLQYDPIPIVQGDLTDAKYFDFIAFAQTATVAQETPKGKQIFKEYCEDCPDGTKIVRRAPELADNNTLNEKWLELTGDNIYQGIFHGFRGVDFGGPSPCAANASFELLLSNIEIILALFKQRGFALNIKLEDVDPAAMTFTIKTEGPAHLWALQSLSSRGLNAILPDYVALCISAFLKESNRRGEYTLEWTTTSVTEHWKLTD